MSSVQSQWSMLREQSINKSISLLTFITTRTTGYPGSDMSSFDFIIFSKLWIQHDFLCARGKWGEATIHLTPHFPWLSWGSPWGSKWNARSAENTRGWRESLASFEGMKFQSNVQLINLMLILWRVPGSLFGWFNGLLCSINPIRFWVRSRNYSYALRPQGINQIFCLFNWIELNHYDTRQPSCIEWVT